MFFGTNPSVVSQFVHKELLRIQPQVVYTPFAGNFVMEQVALQANPSAIVHSTDISLYSRAIGYALTDQESEIELKEEWREVFPIFDRALSPIEKAVAVVFFAEIAKVAKRAKVAYYQNLFHDAKERAEDYCKQIESKILNLKKATQGMVFYGTDGVELGRRASAGDFLFYDPPVILGDYEKMFQPLEDCFEFRTPTYTEMTDEVKMEDLVHFQERGVTVYYRSNDPKEQVPKGYRQVFHHQYKYGAAYSLFSNYEEAGRYVGTFNPLNESPAKYPIIGPNDEITAKSKVRLLEVKGAVANHYRLMWVKKAQMKDVGTPYLVLIDGKVCGVLQLLPGLTFGHDLVVIISDPAAPTSKYVRLSKLIIAICCTRQVLDMFNEKTMWEHNGFTTRVFTNNPVSMKYRGMFDLHEKKEDTRSNWKYCLIYQNRRNIKATFKEALSVWLQKDGKVTNVTP